MKNPIKFGAVRAVLAYVIAYPWLVIVIPASAVGFIRDAASTAVAVAVAVALLVGFRIALPRVSQLVLGAQRLWAAKVFEMWKLGEMKATVRSAETRMRETVVAESRFVNDLGGDLGAS